MPPALEQSTQATPRARRRLDAVSAMARRVALASSYALPVRAPGTHPRAGETWRIVYADLGEAGTCWPECAEREFGD